MLKKWGDSFTRQRGTQLVHLKGFVPTPCVQRMWITFMNAILAGDGIINLFTEMTVVKRTGSEVCFPCGEDAEPHWL